MAIAVLFALVWVLAVVLLSRVLRQQEEVERRLDDAGRTGR